MSEGLKNRIIAVVLLKNGRLVQSKKFSRYQVLGNPYTIVERLSNWQCDELVYLDISRDANYDLNRDDLNVPNRNSFLDIIQDVSRHCFIPLTVGGGIRNLQDMYNRLHSGADKLAINTQAIKEPQLISAAAREFGSQCVVVSIDAKQTQPGIWQVFIDGGRTSTHESPVSLAKKVEDLGAGEIILNSIDCDGAMNGYDIELVSSVVNSVRIPVIALGGAGNWEHMKQLLSGTKVSAIAAANVFQHTENSVYEAKKYLFEAGLNVRKPALITMSRAGG